MKAATLDGFGGPEVFKVADVDQPTPGPGQLLVRVRTSALNRADTLQREGLYPPPPGESEVPGLELAGDVAGWGDGVTGFKEGQRIFGLVGGGGYAEYALMDSEMAMTIPEGWSYQDAAAVSEVFFTANETIFVLGDLKAGESVLIHAGGSGVGTAGIQMAHHIGARVFITAGSDEKIEKAVALGAEAGINYKTHDFAEEVMRLTDGEGVDVVEDFLAASYLERNLSVLKEAGRLILVGLMGGNVAEINLGLVMTRRIQIKGSVMRSRTLEAKRAITKRFQERWLPVLTAGKIKPVIDSVFPLNQVKEAHQAMDANRNFGKILLSIG